MNIIDNNKENKIKKIPLDLESIQVVGFENWLSSFEWPITWDYFLNIENNIKTILNNHVIKYSDYSDIIVINYKVYIEYSNFAYSLLLKQKLGKSAVFSKNNLYLASVFNNDLPIPIISFPKLKPTKQNYSRVLNYIKRYLIDNKYRFPHFLKSKCYILKESRSENTLKYLQENYLGRIFPISFFDLYNKNEKDKLTEIVREDLTKIAESISDEISLLYRNNEIHINKKQKDFITNHALELFKNTYITLEIIKKNLRKRSIKLFIGANSNYYSRILSVAVRQNGGEVHGFKHGEPLNYMFDLISWMELSLNNYYYEYSDLNVEIMKDIQQKYPPPNKNRCFIKSMNVRNCELFSVSHKSIKQNDKSKIMLIGNYFRNDGFSSATSVFPLLQLKIELEIINLIKEKGYHVVYKMHPENLDKTMGVVNNLEEFKKLLPADVDIECRKFESMNYQIDAYAFYYTGTSTFGMALKSDKPIFLYDVNIRKYPIKILTFLKSSCNYKSVQTSYIN